MRVGLFILLLATMAPGAGLLAQPGPAASTPSRSSLAPAPPLPRPVRTPVDLFRELLGMKPEERAHELAKRPQARAFLEEKLKEFETMTPQAREERLLTLQLRWHLLPLMKLAPGQRGGRLAAMSESDRLLVAERLDQWDLLPEELRRKLIENENLIGIILRPETNGPRPEVTSTNFSPAQRQQVQQDQAKWLSMTEADRQRISAQFKRLFDLTDREKQRTLTLMDAKERLQMQLALARFAHLPSPQREACLRGFMKFTGLSLQEREEFLSSAERWQAMDPKARQIWRDLVVRLQPQAPIPPPNPSMPNLHRGLTNVTLTKTN